MGNASNNGDGKITLYTNDHSPWAQRVQIVLLELGLQFDEVVIDIYTPREEWFLKINPRGLVPALAFSHPAIGTKNIIESDLIVHLLLDAYPHLSQKVWPAPVGIEGTYLRYRMNHFVDSYYSKVHPEFYKTVFASGTDQVEDRVDDVVSAVRDHIEPLLEDAKPFFAGSTDMTLADIKVAPMILRLHGMSNGILIPSSLQKKLDSLPNFSIWARAVTSRESVQYRWNQKEQSEKLLEILPLLKEKYSASTH